MCVTLFQNNRQCWIVHSGDGIANQPEHLVAPASPHFSPGERERNGAPKSNFQKLKVACSSMRRLAVPPWGKGPPCSEFGFSKIGGPSVSVGFPTVPFFKKFATPKAHVTFYRRSGFYDDLNSPH